ncbi:MAG: acyl-CoA synthetase [Rhodospirillales bacterium]|jgi:fatty-acyl-CoA synthase|nr:acyl-CoA synthetase [Rhodospirillales bacterium]MBT4039221.1 acyl-CoA synthetase [Rhodospirillales bacterium]MBT5350526.1 acyl-CoA synthetase [Rhodospirillales bacterium]MBT5522207.1 acyl-CoA synthetase [Rhodospirillales bacterium]MBT6109528.1 acyl-CoA synthetase [Rhodospirillales bacterium]
MTNPYEQHLDKNDANFTALTPLTLIRRSARVYPDQLAQVHGDVRYTWSETYDRCRRLASALSMRGIGLGDTVAVMAPNVPAIFEAHFGVPMTGAVLNALNIRLDAEALAFILDHGEAKVLITDREFSGVIRDALAIAAVSPLVIDIDDPAFEGGALLGEMDYEAFLATGDPAYDWHPPADEWQAISLNYTSGTTGDPKGVVYHHRGAHLLATGNALAWNIAHHPVYLWTLPMFHCNGWCFPWTLAAVAGTSVSLRQVNAQNVFDAIADYKVTHFCGAPIILGMLVNATPEQRKGFDHKINVMTAAAPPPAAVLEAMENDGFDVIHVYGLTETYGPAVVCAWHPEWDALPPEERARMKSRQGVPYHMLDDLMVADPETMVPVPKDGETMGEIFFRGNIVMKGYLKNPPTTDAAFRGGWFHSGDLAVWHSDNYIQIKDRSKDVIISGGENISSIEVESTLYKHAAVLAVAVVAKPNEKWGETPCAFVELKEGATATEQEIIDFCRENLAHFKCPKDVVFGPLPKTSTGKIQKFKLRD